MCIVCVYFWSVQFKSDKIKKKNFHFRFKFSRNVSTGKYYNKFPNVIKNEYFNNFLNIEDVSQGLCEN